MINYILRRILYAIPIAFGVSVVCFSLVYLAPGDPLQTILPSDASAETMNWRFKSTYKFKVQVAFYSQDRNHEWPGNGQAWDLNASTHGRVMLGLPLDNPAL